MKDIKKINKLVKAYFAAPKDNSVLEYFDNLADDILNHYTIYDLATAHVHVPDHDVLKDVLFASPKYSKEFVRVLFRLGRDVEFYSQLARLKPVSEGYAWCITNGMVDESIKTILKNNRDDLRSLSHFGFHIIAEKLFDLQIEVFKDPKLILKNMTVMDVIVVGKSLAKLGYHIPYKTYPDDSDKKAMADLYSWFYSFCLEVHGDKGAVLFAKSLDNELLTMKGELLNSLIIISASNPVLNIDSKVFKSIYNEDPVDFLRKAAESRNPDLKFDCFQAVSAIRRERRLIELDSFSDTAINYLLGKALLSGKEIKGLPKYMSRNKKKLLENDLSL